jgi:Winged helix-turn helix
MPKLLHARAPLDDAEHRLVRKLATSRHAPADWVWHAKMIVRSWEGDRTSTIAAEVGRHMQTVRERIHAFNARGVDGLGSKPGSGRRPRLVEAERSAILGHSRAGAHDSTRQTGP